MKFVSKLTSAWCALQSWRLLAGESSVVASPRAKSNGNCQEADSFDGLGRNVEASIPEESVMVAGKQVVLE